jgi:hypothetical protein
MKKFLIYILPLLFASIISTSGSYAVTLEGKVVYDTLLTPVPSGYVKALRLNPVTYELVKVDSSNIGAGGMYSLANVPAGQTVYLIAYPSSQLDYVPCYYPGGTNWQEAITINTNTSQSNLNINARKLYNSVHPGRISGTVSYSNGLPLNDAIVYLETYKGELISFGVTGTNGNYFIPNVGEGEFAITSNRIGFVNNSVFGIIMDYNFGTELPNNNFSLKQTVSVSQISSIVPSVYSLYQNYPNPFNPATTIRFDIQKSGNAKISVYDAQGKLIQDIVNQFIPTGGFEVSFDAKNLSSGMYYYRMEINGYSITKKMMLVK